ncbi:MAG: Asp23/Gls24 family envelope stress response protein [Coriobacteriaceae bacterium]|nr:Asp23/Gls24 family envelope stress response protein [Coriobacteriaceae bacterium]
MTDKDQQVVSGSLSVATDVIADLAGYAALESYGVVGMAAPTLQDGFAKMLPARRLRRGILVHSGESGISVELFVVIEHGTNISTVSDNLADRVRFVLEHYAEIPIDDIIVHVQGVHVRKSK